ncbi:erythromycin esterase family protein [Pontibacter sp. 172403-2]|uniref:erythromycin esterase family protein n=1 Tax=Pontibacter rufus TaxID=2791028 RepID=UPI0018AFC458|nr:erythromycin esterase family protein [Pontibacter sp. 172403-2]MBF9255688.1 erythromycin esterase family protein [Pontibacter sp. 172403-2]
MSTIIKRLITNPSILSFSASIIITLLISSWVPERKFVDILEKNSISIPGVLGTGSGEGLSKMRYALTSPDSKVIAIGEQSHGTSEFFKVRTELIKLLSSDKKIKKIGLEAPLAEVEDLNLYLLEDKGDLKSILKSFRLYSYECDEFSDLVSEVKKLNKDRKTKITFFGFDMQSPFRSLEKIMDLAKESNSFPADAIRKLLHTYSLLDQQLYSHNFSKEDFDSLKYISQPILSYSTNLGMDEKSVSMYQDNYRQFLLLNDPSESNQDVNKMSEIRDSLMALNVISHLSDNSKIVILAHNGHVQKSPNVYSKTMGYFLSKSLNNHYKVIGLTTSTGTYTAFNPSRGKIVNDNPIAIPNKDTFEYYFSLVKKPVFFIETAKIRPLMREGERPPKYRLLPYGLVSDEFVVGDALEDFDYIIHINKTSGNKSFYLN